MDWQPIETAPKDSTDFYAVARYGSTWNTYGIGYRYENGRAVAYDSVGDSFEPTHWMPLPEPPK